MWKKSEYTKKEINAAGKAIISETTSPEERAHALKVIDNWRAAHAFPMNTFSVNLKRKVKFIPGAIVVQRLKRLETIEQKLKRLSKMELYRMQDLGGCRIIVPNVSDVYKVVRMMRTSRMRHKEHNFKDYITDPNPDTGYRGYHLIYKYSSDKRHDYDGMYIEVQIRSKLQHLWATAVETVGVFTGNGLKFNQGSERWLYFFRLVSALFSLEEETPVVSTLEEYGYGILGELYKVINELDVITKLYTIGIATKEIGHISRDKKPGYYLLVLDLKNSKLAMRKFDGLERGLEAATEAYNKLEQEDGIDVVLVSAQSYEALVYAYPNYFADIKEFVETFLAVLAKQQDMFVKLVDALQNDNKSV